MSTNPGALSRWNELREAVSPLPERRLLVSAGGCGLAVGASEVVSALRAAAEIQARGIPVIEAGCDGNCHEAVAVTLQRAGRFARRWRHVTAEQIGEIISGLDEPAEAAPEYPGQNRLLLRDVGAIDPIKMEDALRRGRYRTLASALERSPEEIIGEIEQSGLTGRGGAYLSVATKWSGCRSVPGQRYLVANGEEGEPGVFKDRHLLEGDPHLVLEGMLIGAYAIGANEIIAYVNGEARLAGDRLAGAIREAREKGFIGERILGSDFSCDISIRYGAGGYVLGEQTAQLESIEGRRPIPRSRPPQPFHAGLFGRPTAINNIESLAAATLILEHGATWFRGFGTDRAPGTKLICVTGNVARPGLVEVEMGTPAREVIAICRDDTDEAIQAVLAGGPSGALVAPADLDRPLIPRDDVVFLGSGNLTVVDTRQDLAAFVLGIARFNADESCGKCTPCREGTKVMVELLERIQSPAGTEGDREELDLLCDVVASGSICGLGQMAPAPIRSWLTHFAPACGRGSETADA